MGGSGGMTLPVVEMMRDTGVWFTAEGPLADAVLSTRVRLARNLSDLRFPPRALPEELHQVLARLEPVLGRTPPFEGRALYPMEGLSALERQFLLERHLASHELVSDGRHRGLAFAADESLSVMVNEEDHLRLQALAPGFQLDACYAAVAALDERLGAAVDYAFADDFGFLTACPTNVGTGMRASVLIHLPALVLTRRIKKVLAGVNQVGLAVRGFYGEGSDVLGNFFQVSNQITLGEKESQTLLNLERVIHQVLEHEARAREVLLKDAGDQIRDKVQRALGVLEHAHLLSSQEVVGLASAIRLGITMEMADLPSLAAVNGLLLSVQPAHLQLRAGSEMGSQERNAYRAALVRESLARPGSR
jgi:protein arginine kinase